MILPGLVSAAFYRRRPSRLQVALGVVFTVAFSGLLGYVQDAGTARVWLNVAVAIIGGLVLYWGIFAYLVYRYFPSHPERSGTAARSSAPPTR